MTARDLRALRDAAADAAAEVLWHLEREGEAPAHMLAHAEALLRAAGALDEPPSPSTGGAVGEAL